jgi:hypothetical protein
VVARRVLAGGRRISSVYVDPMHHPVRPGRGAQAGSATAGATADIDHHVARWDADLVDALSVGRQVVANLVSQVGARERRRTPGLGEVPAARSARSGRCADSTGQAGSCRSTTMDASRSSTGHRRGVRSQITTSTLVRAAGAPGGPSAIAIVPGRGSAPPCYLVGPRIPRTAAGRACRATRGARRGGRRTGAPWPPSTHAGAAATTAGQRSRTSFQRSRFILRCEAAYASLARKPVTSCRFCSHCVRYE